MAHGERDDDARLAGLLEQFRDLRRSNPKAGIGALHEEAGRLFDRLMDLADCERLIEAVVADDAKDPLTEFAGYRILEQLGEGAAGVVYRAIGGDGRTVALKVMKPTLFASAEALARFAQEAHIAERLQHPHIVRVFDAGQVEGRMYIAMELLAGRSLADVLKGIKAACRTPPDESWLGALDHAGIPKVGGAGGRSGATYARRLAKALAPVADALGALAAQGIVHRDIKPGNLVFDSRGNLKVTDFGLAKVFGEAITSTVAVLGTIAYMSPEQARGESREVDRRTDVYSLGATLYEALTLQYPVRGTTFGEALGAIQLERPKPITSFCTDYEGPLAVLVGRCLEKDPRDRYQEPVDLARDLAQFAETSSVSAKPVSPARRFQRFLGKNRGAAATVGSTLGGALIVAVFLATRPAKVEIASIPAGIVAIDGETVGKAPWHGSLSSGRHSLSIALERFKPFEKELDLSPGQTFGDTYPLWPVDDSDPVALNVLKEAWGFKVTFPTTEPEAARALPIGAPWNVVSAIVSPNGRVTPDGLVIALRLEDPPPGLSVRVTDGADRLLFEHVLDGQDLPLAPGMFAPGESYRVVVSREGSPETLAAGFEVVNEAGLAGRLAGVPADLREEPAMVILGVGQLLDAGLCSEAFLAAERLAAREGTMPLRLALDALARLGLIDRGIYTGFMNRYEAALEAGGR